ncbi:ribonuclease P protein component [Haloimpatiens sp. FM7315]|uniref:ribonuclease P protein component n=1 Tax=Haloimpatiens sp. FM7315 TaxID=3298609 RepID=UPI0035A300AD
MKEEVVRKNLEFRRIYKRGRSFSNKLLVLYIYKNRDNINLNRLGISVSKKVGKSVTRSRVKRLIKESYRLNKENVKKGFDFVVIARVNSNDKPYKDIEASLINLFKKAGLYNNEGNFYKDH